jgi:rhodanese-related sulfurtransferase
MNGTPSQAPVSISAAELQRRLQNGDACELLDVRTPPEHAVAHVPGVNLVPLDELNPATYIARRNTPAAPIYVFCQAGGRAKKAIEMFRTAGFDGGVLVEGGTEAWIAAGLPVERSASRVLPLQRQVHLVIGFFTALAAVLTLTVNPLFAVISLITGCGLLINGTTGWCGLALFLAKLPWNRGTARS